MNQSGSAIKRTESQSSLRADDAIRIVRCVAQAGAIADPRRRVTVAIAEFMQVLDADFATAVQSFIDPQTGDASFSEMIECGDLTDEGRHAYLDYMQSGRHGDDPLYAAVGEAAVRLAPTDPIVILLRQEAVPDEQWYGGTFYKSTRSRLGMDACIYAGLRGATPGEWVGSGFHRAIGKPQFTPYDLHVAKCFLLGARPLFDAFLGSPKGAATFLGALPKRQRELVVALLEGLSGKQAARRLGITESTLHTYCKRLYKALGVSGRAELTKLCQDKGLFIFPAGQTSY